MLFIFGWHTFKTNGKRILLRNLETLMNYELLEIVFAFVATNEMAERRQ